MHRASQSSWDLLTAMGDVEFIRESEAPRDITAFKDLRGYMDEII